jgi:hypothetical protein
MRTEQQWRNILATNFVGKRQNTNRKERKPEGGGDANERNSVIISNRECSIDISPFQGLT